MLPPKAYAVLFFWVSKSIIIQWKKSVVVVVFGKKLWAKVRILLSVLSTIDLAPFFSFIFGWQRKMYIFVNNNTTEILFDCLSTTQTKRKEKQNPNINIWFSFIHLLYSFLCYYLTNEKWNTAYKYYTKFDLTR